MKLPFIYSRHFPGKVCPKSDRSRNRHNNITNKTCPSSKQTGSVGQYSRISEQKRRGKRTVGGEEWKPNLIIIITTTISTTKTAMASTDPIEIKAAIDQPGAVILDVRRKDEIDAAPFTKKPYKHATCSLDDCSELLEKAEMLMPDKNGE